MNLPTIILEYWFPQWILDLLGIHQENAAEFDRFIRWAIDFSTIILEYVPAFGGLYWFWFSQWILDLLGVLMDQLARQVTASVEVHQENATEFDRFTRWGMEKSWPMPRHMRMTFSTKWIDKIANNTDGALHSDGKSVNFSNERISVRLPTAQKYPSIEN